MKSIEKQLHSLLMNLMLLFIPPFEVSKMVNRKIRKITHKTARKMLSWAHYKFRQHLIAKAEEVGVHIIIQNEAYTSKTQVEFI